MNNSNLFEYMQNPKKLKKDMDILVTYNTLCSVNKFIYNNLSDENKENIDFIDHEIIFSLSKKNKKKILDTIVEQFNVYKELVNLLERVSLITSNLKYPDTFYENKETFYENKETPNIKELSTYENEYENKYSSDESYYKKKLERVMKRLKAQYVIMSKILVKYDNLKKKYIKYKEKYLKTKRF